MIGKEQVWELVTRDVLFILRLHPLYCVSTCTVHFHQKSGIQSIIPSKLLHVDSIPSTLQGYVLCPRFYYVYRKVIPQMADQIGHDSGLVSTNAMEGQMWLWFARASHSHIWPSWGRGRMKRGHSPALSVVVSCEVIFLALKR